MTSRPHRTQRTNALGRTELLLLLAAVAILVAQQLAISNLGRDGAEAAFRRSIFFVTTPLLVGIALCFRRYWGAWLIAAGILLNFLPISAHGGLMPVSYTIVRDSGAFPEITNRISGDNCTTVKTSSCTAMTSAFLPFRTAIPSMLRCTARTSTASATLSSSPAAD